MAPMDDGTSNSMNETWWECVYQELAPRLYAYFYSYSRGDASLAEDLLQEQAVKALHGIPNQWVRLQLQCW